MKITPIDIRQQQFGRTLRGLDAREVDSFLNLVSDELETALLESNQLREELARTSRIVDEYRDRERALKETMITAQRITDDIKESARKEAEVIISRAEIQAEKIIHAANDRLVKLIEDINEVKRQREQLTANLIGVVEAHRKHLHEFEDEKAEGMFVNVEDLKQRRIRLQAAIQETLEAHAKLLQMDRDREIEHLREETEKLHHFYIHLNAQIQAVVNTHTKLLQARDEAEGRSRSYKMEEKLKVLKPAKNEEQEVTIQVESAPPREEVKSS
jgi:cell division initiation protein